MKVSVITVCLNAVDTVEHTIASVLRAGDAVTEYLVIDGGSTDGTVEVIGRFEPRFSGRMRWVSEPDQGIYPAMNRGASMADDDSYLLFIGADDTLCEGALEQVAEQVAKSPSAPDLVYGDVRVVDADGSAWVERACGASKRIGGIPRSMPACHQAILVTARAFRQLGGFDESLALAADYDLYLRLVDAGTVALYVPAVIAEFSLSGASATRGVATADEYREVWVRHGVSPTIARLRMIRSILNLGISKVMRRTRAPRS